MPALLGRREIHELDVESLAGVEQPTSLEAVMLDEASKTLDEAPLLAAATLKCVRANVEEATKQALVARGVTVSPR